MTTNQTESTCPVEPFAREIAQLIRLQTEGKSPSFREQANLGEEYASTLIQERIEALSTLASFETPRSRIGTALHLFLARCAMPVSEIPDDVWEGHKGAKREARKREDFAERNIANALAFIGAEVGDDPDFTTLESRFGEDPDDGRPSLRLMEALAQVA